MAGVFPFAEEILAHGDLHERIVAAGEAIKLNNKSAELYFERGELYRQHWEQSLDRLGDYLKELQAAEKQAAEKQKSRPQK